MIFDDFKISLFFKTSTALLIRTRLMRLEVYWYVYFFAKLVLPHTHILSPRPEMSPPIRTVFTFLPSLAAMDGVSTYSGVAALGWLDKKTPLVFEVFDPATMLDCRRRKEVPMAAARGTRLARVLYSTVIRPQPNHINRCHQNCGSRRRLLHLSSLSVPT